jgi:predicted transposase/invertase (TIGR01784 family)
MNIFVSPSSDIFFRYLLGSEANKDLLISFINSVNKDSDLSPIVDVQIKNPFNLKEFSQDKETIIDIKGVDERGRQYDIEAQATGNFNFRNRSLYYWAKLYTSQIQESDSFAKLRPTVCINLLNFKLFPDINQLHNCFLLREKNEPEYVLTDHLVLHFLELQKPEDHVHDPKLKRWLSYFKNEGQKEDLMQILIKEDEDIAKAHERYKIFTEDDRMKELYEARIKRQLDYNTDIEVARQEGIEAVAKSMKKKGYSLPEIQELTGLDSKNIEEL